MTQKTNLQVEGTTCDDFFTELDKRFAKISDALSKLQPPTEQDRYITRQDVADMYGVTLVTVHSWMNAGILKPFKIGNKTRFLFSEAKAAAIGSHNRKS